MTLTKSSHNHPYIHNRIYSNPLHTAKLQAASEHISGRNIAVYLFNLNVSKKGAKKIVFDLAVLERNKFAFLAQNLRRLSQNEAG